MPSVKVRSVSIMGLEAVPIDVEVDVVPGLHSFTIVGLPGKSVDESKERISAGLRNCGFSSPKQKNHRITVNLAPANIRKEGPAYDLPIALGYLIATGQLKSLNPKSFIIGELSLDGSIRAVAGVLPTALKAKEEDSILIIPDANLDEARISGLTSIIPATDLKTLVSKLHSGKITKLDNFDYGAYSLETRPDESPFKYIKGQFKAKRAMVIAASGSHNIMLSGQPGTGKTLLAKTLPQLLPPLSHAEALEVTKIYSVSDLIDASDPLITRRPFRNPHHTSSTIAVIGGGTTPKPGEISLAHRGVLFLDEFPEFSRTVIESLRQPLEDGVVTVSRISGTARYPTRFMLVAAMNPCPCGNFGHSSKACICSPRAIEAYQKKISGPIQDRIDIHTSVNKEKISINNETSVDNADYYSQVFRARKIQERRYVQQSFKYNSEIPFSAIENYCHLLPDSENLLDQAIVKYDMSRRSMHKVLRVARTIADLEGLNQISKSHLAEALTFRQQYTTSSS